MAAMDPGRGPRPKRCRARTACVLPELLMVNTSPMEARHTCAAEGTWEREQTRLSATPSKRPWTCKGVRAQLREKHPVCTDPATSDQATCAPRMGCRTRVTCG